MRGWKRSRDLTGEMNNHIWCTWDWAALPTTHVEMSSQGIEDLALVCKVGLESVNVRRRVWEGGQVKIQDLYRSYYTKNTLKLVIKVG